MPPLSNLTQRFPLFLRWTGALPSCVMRGAGTRGGPPEPHAPRGNVLGLGPPPWISSGPCAAPFDFTGHVRRLLEDIVARCPEFAHIQMSKVLVGMLRARNGHPHGLQARVSPLRFGQGQLQKRRRGVLYQVQRYFLDAQEFLYVMTFCLPRFLEQDFDSKFITLVHELYHIGPLFDGDLRRHEGRYQLHTRSKKQYDKHMAELARGYLAAKPDPALHDFLRLTFAQLLERHGAIAGIMVPRPKMVPVQAV